MTADRPTHRAASSPFAGLPRGHTINELRTVHAEIIDLASSSSRLGGVRQRRRLRAARRTEAELLHRLGFSSFAAFTLAFPDTRDAPQPSPAIAWADGPVLTEEPPAGAPAAFAPLPPFVPEAREEPRTAPERGPLPDPQVPPDAEVPPAAEAAEDWVAPRAPEPEPEPEPLRRGERLGMVADDPEEIILNDASPEHSEVDVRDEVVANELAATRGSVASHWRPVSVDPSALEPPKADARPLGEASEFEMLRRDLGELLTEMTTAIRGATAEIRALGELARDQRLDLEHRRVGADEEARRVLEIAEAEATVLRLEAFAAARRIRAQVGSRAATEADQDHRDQPNPPAGLAATLAVPPAPAPAPAPSPQPAPPPPARPAAADTQSAAVVQPATEPVPAAVPEPGRRKRRRKRRVRTAFVVAVAAIVLLGGLFAVAYAMRSSGDGGSDHSTTVPTPPRAKSGAVPAAGTAKRAPEPAAASAHPGGSTQRTSPVTDASDLARENAYATAFRGECVKLWSHAGADGLLWDPDNLDAGSHRVGDCLQALDPTLGATYTSDNDATGAGRSDADSAAAEMTVGNRLQPTGGGGAFNIP